MAPSHEQYLQGGRGDFEPKGRRGSPYALSEQLSESQRVEIQFLALTSCVTLRKPTLFLNLGFFAYRMKLV